MTWKQKLAYYGLEVTRLPDGKDGWVNVKVRYPGGLAGMGHGDTEEEALENAALQLPLSWNACERGFTELEWSRIAHE